MNAEDKKYAETVGKELARIQRERYQEEAKKEQEPTKGQTCYFIMETERDEQGNYIPCIAKEGERGFWRTDWQWGKDKAIAEECADDMNERMGTTKRQAMIIQLRSMRTS